MCPAPHTAITLTSCRARPPPHPHSSFLGRAYAKLVLGFWQDLMLRPMLEPGALPGLDLSEPVYVMEIGSASGRFAHMFVRSMLSMLPVIPYLRALKWKFIMTDLPQKNIDSWISHPSLRPLMAAGVLDCARYDASDPEKPFVLMMTGEVVRPKSLANPLVAFANYVFCVIEMDAFRVRHGGA